MKGSQKERKKLGVESERDENLVPHGFNEFGHSNYAVCILSEPLGGWDYADINKNITSLSVEKLIPLHGDCKRWGRLLTVISYNSKLS